MAGADDEDGVADARPPQAVSMQPSSIGLSFVVSGEAEALRITARWGRYLRGRPGRGVHDIRRLYATPDLASDPGRGRRRGGCAAARTHALVGAEP